VTRTGPKVIDKVYKWLNELKSSQGVGMKIEDSREIILKVIKDMDSWLK